MGALFDQIRAAVREDRVYITDHADERLRERRVEVWQVLAGVEDGELITERPDDTPNPSAEVRQLLPDGTAILAVWAYWRAMAAAKLVTVHFFDR
jgi:hypothetical protein